MKKNNTINQKKNHFVPNVYLKKWAHKENELDYVYIVNNKTGRPVKEQTRNIGKKKNLYTLPVTFQENLKKFSENFSFKLWEDSWGKVIPESLDKNKLPIDGQIGQISGFIYMQSIRSIKFKFDTEELLNKKGDSILRNIDWGVIYAYLSTQGWMDNHNTNQMLHLLRAPIGKRFITSDNPATHWIVQNSNYINLKTTFGSSNYTIKVQSDINLLNILRTYFPSKEVQNNPYYKILCPLTPKWYGVLTPFANKKTKDDNDKCYSTELTEKQLHFFNKLTESTSNKIIIASELEDFI